MKKLLLLLSVLTLPGYSQTPSMLKDINLGTGMSMSSNDMRNGFVYNNGLFFQALDATGKFLWYSSGTALTTKKIIPSSTSLPISISNNYLLYKNRVLFSDNSNVWISDGTDNGTYKISSIPSLTINSTFYVFNNKVYFIGSTSATGKELYQTDSAIGSTVLLKDIWPGVGNSNIGELLDDKAGGFYFFANNGTNGTELWHSDGTSGNTNMVKDIFPGSPSSSLQLMAMANNTLFFMADDGINGKELWRSDGTNSGTFLLNNLTAGSGSSAISMYTSYSNRFIFSHNYTSISETDGIVINNITIPITPPFSLRGSFYEFNNELFMFGIRTKNMPTPNTMDSVTLFKINAAVVTLARVKTIEYATGVNSSSFSHITFDGKYANKFIARESNNAQAANDYLFMISDGTTAGTVFGGISLIYVTELFNQFPGVVSNTTIPFISNKWIVPMTSWYDGMELHSIDYFTNAVTLVKDIKPGPAGHFQGSGMDEWTNYEILNNKIYFLADGGGTGMEPWVSDGTNAGTNLLMDINPGSATGPDNMGFVRDVNFSIRRSGNCLYFVADNGVNGKEPWVICDGPLGVAEKTLLTNDFTLWPNPASDKIKLKSQNHIQTITITDIFGKTVLYFENIDQNEFEINTSSLAQGFYFATIKSENGTGVKKFVKQ